ncbi:hypothetical protein BYZ73_13745 [Rhodovulum viride]|uniref:Uncharacterized protein n=1 Tax=Rhodovulum viride TaxID=1231134 RepID=A0ABX9DE79_9RHOB|nr:hypothetical protein [Rhodovulum viride]RAP40645.1 hypothetical protein BYZ73_13745 [Rhodovulum viride]
MDRLSLLLTPMTGAVITGMLVIVMFSLGFYSWISVAIGAGIGCILAWPSAYVVSRRIKQADPRWPTRAEADRLRSGLPEV